MILVIDVGNTNITFGVFSQDELVSSFRMTTQMPRTSDEFGINLLTLLSSNGVTTDDIEGVMIASVVPKTMHALVNAIEKYIGKRP
ncbi:MAG: type III pantothenate kinase, partial [Butyrivibrio sp.]|nr:type III pantothenate kinase [Butyrivibrio sp.]